MRKLVLLVATESMDAKGALSAWEKANNVSTLSADELYAFDAEKYKESLKGEPWKKEYAFGSCNSLDFFYNSAH